MSVELTSPCLQFRGFRTPMPPRGQLTFLDLAAAPLLIESPVPDGKPGLILFRATSGVCGIMPVEISARKADKPVFGLAVLHHGDELNIAGYPAVFCEIFRLTLQPEDQQLRRPCPYCQESFQVADQVIRCPLCNEAYHEKCWTGLSGEKCCSRNCSFSPGSFTTSDQAPGSILVAVSSADYVTRT